MMTLTLLRRSVRAIWLALLLTLVSATPLKAQFAQRSSIVGRVLDQTDAPVSGASVTLSGDSVLGGERRVSTDRDGRFRFGELLPGWYDVAAEAPGLQRRERGGIWLPVETSWTVDFRLDISSVTEQVNVVAPTPLVDVTTAASPARFERELLQNLPAGRSLESFFNLAPGITANVAFGGAQISSNSFSVDRVSTVESFQGKNAVPVPFNWYESMQVVAPGAPAEYGQFTGAQGNAVLRSGSNLFSWQGDFAAAVPDWMGNNTRTLSQTLQTAFTPRNTLTHWDVDGQLGGPIRHDVLWFLVGLGAARDQFRPFNYSGPAATDRDDRSALVKLDAAVRSAVRLQGYYLGDRSTAEGVGLGPGRPTLESTPDSRRRNHLWNARATWLVSNATFVEVQNGGYTGSTRNDPHPPATLVGPPVRRDLSTGVWSENAVTVSRGDRDTVTSSARLSHRRRLWRGDHDVVAGFEHERSHAYEFTNIGGGGRNENYLGATLVSVVLWDGNRTDTTNHRTTVYVQDRWLVGDRVTLEPGLRVETYRGYVPVAGEVFSTNPIALRLGVAWDVTESHRTVVRGHYGRYYDMPFAYIYSWQDEDGFTPRITGIEPEPGVFVETSRFVDAIPASPISDELRQSYVDQWTLGVERQLFHDLAIEGRYMHRRFGDFIGYVDGRLDEWTTYTAPDPGPDGVLGNGDDGGTLVGYRRYSGEGDLAIANPDGAYRRYDAIQAIARKRHSAGWEMQASYTWSRSVGTISGSEGSNYTFSPLSPIGFGNEPGYEPARSQFDYSEAKALGFYRMPWLHGAVIGAVYRWHTGTRWQRVAVVPPFSDRLVAETPNSRRTPSLGLLDLRVEKTGRMPGASGVIGVYIDAINVTNVGRALSYVPRSGPTFAQPNRWTDPRTIRLGVRYSF